VHAARPDERIDLILAEKAAAFLSQTPNATPFFLYIAFAAPHSPVNPAPEFRGRSQAGLYGDYVEQLDHCFGRVLDALDACDAARDTLVIVTSDNGAVCTRDALAAGHHANGVLLGQKTDVWEGGHRVPLIARWPGRIPAGSQRQALFTQVDIMATLAEAAGVELPPGASPDGTSDLAAFSDPERAPAKRGEALFQGTGSYALRQGDWLYIPKQGSGGMTVQVPPRAPWGLPYAKLNQRNSDIDPQGKLQPGAPPAQLYNLRDDLSQTTNRFRDQPATAKRLAARLAELLPKSR
jgi:arylsulfatase A-like enzyme